jgi:hypothetical protein
VLSRSQALIKEAALRNEPRHKPKSNDEECEGAQPSADHPIQPIVVQFPAHGAASAHQRPPRVLARCTAGIMVYLGCCTLTLISRRPTLKLSGWTLVPAAVEDTAACPRQLAGGWVGGADAGFTRRPLAYYIRKLGATWTGTRGTKANAVEGEHTLFGFLTCDPNAVHPKAMPVILTTDAEIEQWMTAPAEEALKLQRAAS